MHQTCTLKCSLFQSFVFNDRLDTLPLISNLVNKKSRSCRDRVLPVIDVTDPRNGDKTKRSCSNKFDPCCIAVGQRCHGHHDECEHDSDFGQTPEQRGVDVKMIVPMIELIQVFLLLVFRSMQEVLRMIG